MDIFIKKCGVPQCKLCRCDQLDTNTKFNGCLSKEIFEITFDQTCKTSSVVYLITCKQENCAMQYVGKTKLPLNRRLSLHRGNILFGSEGICMLNHFTKKHNPSDMQIKAIEICAARDLDGREKFWMDRLNVSFPYGLNDRVSKKGVQDVYAHVMENNCNNKTVYELFDVIPSRRSRKGGKRRNGNVPEEPYNFDPSMFMVDIMDANNIERKFFINHVRNNVMHLKNDYTKLLFIHLIIAIKDNNEQFKIYSNCCFNEYLPYLVRDLCLAKLKKSLVPKKHVDHYIVFSFVNKYMDGFNISGVIRNKAVQNLFPVNDINLKMPGVAFKYSDTIRKKIVNYKQAIEEGVIPANCECHTTNNEYVDVNSQHVFTGNLEIIQNGKLRSLFKKGLKFREIPQPNKENILESLNSGLDRYITETSNKRMISEVCFLPWKQEILKLLQPKIDNLAPYKFNNILAIKANNDDLLALQKKFVFIPTDKASNNISVVCKKFYMESLHQEICSSATFTETPLSAKDVTLEHTAFLKQYGLKSSGKIPFLYWISKLHKHPLGKRFITSGKGGTLEKLSVNIGICLKTILKIILSDARYHKGKTGISKCFVINNRDPVVNFMKNNMNNERNKNVKTFDFETLYTSIPQDKLKNEISTLIKNFFVLKKKRFISVSGKHAYLALKRSKSGFSVSFNQLIYCINYLIDNSYVTYREKVYRQTLGIPMGTNCAPYLANLFLHCYEAKFIDKLIIEGKSQDAILLNSVFRYQDDCIVFNDDDYFSRNWKHIYPREMMLKETNVDTRCNYLDLTILNDNNVFQYKSYDKRLDFNFDVINYPDLTGNIPNCQSYGVFTSQIIRFCEVNSEFEGFEQDIKRLINNLTKQGFDIGNLKTKFLDFCVSNISRWAKFGRDINDMIHLFH